MVRYDYNNNTSFYMMTICWIKRTIDVVVVVDYYDDRIFKNVAVVKFVEVLVMSKNMINCRMQSIFNYKQRQLVCGGYN